MEGGAVAATPHCRSPTSLPLLLEDPHCCFRAQSSPFNFHPSQTAAQGSQGRGRRHCAMHRCRPASKPPSEIRFEVTRRDTKEGTARCHRALATKPSLPELHAASTARNPIANADLCVTIAETCCGRPWFCDCCASPSREGRGNVRLRDAPRKKSAAVRHCHCWRLRRRASGCWETVLLL
ncbi:uncharacterized protein DS421_18g623860 [Arachis hypogaea]|nr:uncharacterized protein DS421_18g623860 [Arachis hypogaea]